MSGEKLSVDGRLPSLDGWRALSIVLVLGAHSPGVEGFPLKLYPIFDWICDGHLGVRFFFVISGFLITRLLVREHEQTNAINLKNFYLRRALRILPVYFAFLAVMSLLQLFTGWHQGPFMWFCDLTFLSNFSYHPGYGWTTGHLATLAVEEQFYLIWPLLLKLIGLNNNNKTLLVVLIIPLIVAPLCRAITYLHLAPRSIHALFQWSSTLNYFDSLAIGCIAAIGLYGADNAIPRWVKLKWWNICIGLLFLLVPWLLSNLYLLNGLMACLGPTFQGLGFAMLLVQSIRFPSLFAPLNWKVVSQLGVLSYSLYIWQQIFCSNPRYFGFSHLLGMTFPWWLLFSLGAAMVSFFCLEKPFMRLRKRFRDEESAPVPA